MWSYRNSHSLLVGMQIGSATLEDSLAVSYNSKHTLTTWFSNCTSCYLPKGVEKLCPQKTCTNMFIADLLIIAKT